MEKEQPTIDLQSKLSSILDWVEQTAKSAEQFAIEQTPLYIQELLAWNFWISLFNFLFGVILLVIFGFCLKTVIKRGPSLFDDETFVADFISCVFGFLAFVIGMAIFSNNLQWIQIWVAPRVWLVEYVASKL